MPTHHAVAHSRPAVERFDPARRTPPDPRLMQALIDDSITKGPPLILWDLVGSCNLRCPSCPRGNMAPMSPKGLISDELFHRILDKLAREFPRWQLHFYNWTEPLIHPRIVEFCTAAAQRGFHLHISSNLNHLRDADGLMSAGMKTFRISLSGFSQPVYAAGHKGGDIEKVKRNMVRLAQAKAATHSRTRVHVYFHKYRHNLHEQPLMEQFARDLGFEFVSDFAYLMPLEKLIALVEDELTPSQREFADRHIVPDTSEAVALMQPLRHLPCELINQLTLDFRGQVALCCAVYDFDRNCIGNYLDMDWPQMQRSKYGHATCEKCMHYAAHVLYPSLGVPQRREMLVRLAQESLAGVPRESERSQPIALPVLS